MMRPEGEGVVEEKGEGGGMVCVDKVPARTFPDDIPSHKALFSSWALSSGPP